MRGLVARRRDGRHGLFAGHPPMTDFQRQVVKQAGESEFVPLQKVVQRNERIVDIRVIIIPGVRPLRPCLEAVRAGGIPGCFRVQGK